MPPQGDSARFLLRLPRELHHALRRAAASDGVSLNEYCVRRLSAPGGGLASHPDAASVVRRALNVGGNALAGVVLYGSWARGSAGPASDVDVLVVLDRARPLARSLYREWDAETVLWEGRTVDAHFVHLPDDGASPGGVWGEAAVDGVMLYETGLRVSAHLASVRRDIAAGRLVRRTLHGQPYWVAA